MRKELQEILNPSYRKFPTKTIIPRIKPYGGHIKHIKGDIVFSTNIHVETLANLTLRQAKGICTSTRYKKRGHGFLKTFLDIKTGYRKYWSPTHIDAIVDYPLKGKYIISNIPPALNIRGQPMIMSIGHFLWYIARVYKNIIYKNQNIYGVWGHQLSDLYFEAIILKPIRKGANKGIAIVEFGS